MKATGAEIKDFYDNGWPEGYYVEDVELEYIGNQDEWLLEPGTKYDLKLMGMLCPNEIPQGVHYSEISISFESAFKAWRKKSTTVTFGVTIPKEQEAALRDFVKTLKGTLS